MSNRSYYRRRSSPTSPYLHALWLLIILLAALIWVHKTLPKRVERYGALALAALIFLALLGGLSRLDGHKMMALPRKRSMRIQDIDSMSGLEFEHYIAKLLKAKGYKRVLLTEKYDLGIDITAKKDGVKWGIQIKRHAGPVRADAIRQAVTALTIYGCDRPMVITNSYFTNQAKRLALSNSCLLIDRRELIRLQSVRAGQ